MSRFTGLAARIARRQRAAAAARRVARVRAPRFAQTHVGPGRGAPPGTYIPREREREMHRDKERERERDIHRDRERERDIGGEKEREQDSCDRAAMSNC